MKFSFSSEQEEFRSSLRRFLAERSPTKEVRRLMETEAGLERDAWRKLNAELGLTAVRIPEAYGGRASASANSASCWRKWAARCSVRRSFRPLYSPPAPS